MKDGGDREMGMHSQLRGPESRHEGNIEEENDGYVVFTRNIHLSAGK
jgi:hypothetical protein